MPVGASIFVAITDALFLILVLMYEVLTEEHCVNNHITSYYFFFFIVQHRGKVSLANGLICILSHTHPCPQTFAYLMKLSWYF